MHLNRHSNVLPQILLNVKLLTNYKLLQIMPSWPNSLSENEDVVLIRWQINEFYICMYDCLKGYQATSGWPN